MQEHRQRIVILLKERTNRGQEGEMDPYEDACRQQGMACYFWPVLQVSLGIPEEWSELHGARLDRLRMQETNPYHGLIFTSANAVKGFRHVLSREILPLEHLRHLSCFCVGKATADAIVAELGLVPLGQDTGTAESLVTFIRNHYQKNDRKETVQLLFLSGTNRRPTLPDAFDHSSDPQTIHTKGQEERPNHIYLDECHVYGTTPRPHASKHFTWRHFQTHLTPFTDSLSLQSPASHLPHEVDYFLCWFSPLGVKALSAAYRDLLSKTGEEKGARLFCIAIGPTTAQSLRNLGFTVDTVAEKATPTHLVHAISLIPKQNAVK